MEILLLFWHVRTALHIDTGVEDPWEYSCYSGCHYTSIQESNSWKFCCYFRWRYFSIQESKTRGNFYCYSGLALHFDTGDEDSWKFLLLFWLAQHFDIGVEDSWKFCCQSKQSLQPISSEATACKQLNPRN